VPRFYAYASESPWEHSTFLITLHFILFVTWWWSMYLYTKRLWHEYFDINQKVLNKGMQK